MCILPELETPNFKFPEGHALTKHVTLTYTLQYMCTWSNIIPATTLSQITPTHDTTISHTNYFILK